MMQSHQKESEEIHKIKSKDCDCFLENNSFNDDFIKFKCFYCNKDYLSNVDEKFKKAIQEDI